MWGSLFKRLGTSSYHKDGDTYRTSATNGSTLQWTAVVKPTRMTTQNPECYQTVATRKKVSKALLEGERWVPGTCFDSPTFEPCMVTYLQVSSRTYSMQQSKREIAHWQRIVVELGLSKGRSETAEVPLLAWVHHLKWVLEHSNHSQFPWLDIVHNPWWELPLATT